jgi:hypothetical protein
MTFARAQSPVQGTPVTSGTTVTATYGSATTTGNLLVAVVSRVGSSVATIGIVTDTQGNKWKQAGDMESTVAGTEYGCDVWVCERNIGGSAPTVTASLIGYPPNTLTNMTLTVMEYSGATGYELAERIGQVIITTTSVSAVTQYSLSQNHELAVSVVCGNMSAATVPSTWSSVIADATHNIWIADQVDTGTSSGSTYTAAWTGLTAGSQGVGFIVTFVATGVGSSSPRLVAMSYSNPPIGTTALSTLSRAYPVNPAAGSTLIILTGGADYLPTPAVNHSSAAITVSDTASNTWSKLASSGGDNLTGVDWVAFVANNVAGGSTTVTVTFDGVITQGAILLLEFVNLPASLVKATIAFTSSTTATTISLTTPYPAQVADFAISALGYVGLGVDGRTVTPASGWKQVMSDTKGAGNVAMQLSVGSLGTLSCSWTSPNNLPASDALLTTLRTSYPPTY